MEESKDVIATSREADEKAVGSQDNENGSGAQLLDPEARPLCFKSTFEEILFVLTATMAIGMGSILTGSITVITSFVGDDLGMTTAEITWISSASSLAGGSFLLFFGKIADLFGRKMLIVGSLFLFAVFALVAGFAKTPINLDVLNGVMGLLTASAVPAAQGTLGAIYPKPSKRKNWAFACFSAGNPLGFVFGTVFSGIASDIFNWRASFFLLAIIYCVLSFVAIWTVPRDTTAKQPLTWETLRRFDIMGTVLTIGGIGMFCAALSSGDTAPEGWKTGYIIALLVVGFALMVAFVFWEIYFPYPLMPMSIWKDKNFCFVILTLLLGFMAFPVASFFMSLYFQDVWHFSSLETAVHLLPMVVCGILVNIFAGMVLHKISNKKLMIFGAFAYFVAFLLLSFNQESSTYWSFCFVALCIAVVGADIEFNVANMYVMSSLPPEQQSTAGSIFQTVTKLCQSVGFGIGTAVYDAVQDNPSMIGYYKNDKVTQPYSAVFWFCTASAALGVVFACFLTIGTQGGSEKEADADENGERS